MENKELQVENGHYTRIVNPLIENLIKIPFKGCELAVVLYIIRKTYGYQKKQDEISLSQFQKDLKRSRNTIIFTLKSLKSLNIIRLVKKGNTNGACNSWSINKYYDTWKLVQTPALVQASDLVQTKYQPSAVEALNLVQTPEHTKENTKENTKETSGGVPPRDINSFIDLFKSINPTYERLFGNKTERASSERLLKKFGLEKMTSMFDQLPDILGQPYAPRISTPNELEKNLGKLLQFIKQGQNKIINKKPIVLI